jgi:hypothetical protein
MANIPRICFRQLREEGDRQQCALILTRDRGRGNLFLGGFSLANGVFGQTTGVPEPPAFAASSRRRGDGKRCVTVLGRTAGHDQTDSVIPSAVSAGSDCRY